MLLIIVLSTLLIVIVSVLPLFRFSHWIVRGMDFPRLQIAFLAASLIILQFISLDLQLATSWLLISATALCFLWQLWWILPYTFIWPVEVKYSKVSDQNKQLSIITSNVLKTNRNSSALINLVEKYQPDILVSLESDEWWENEFKALEACLPYSVKCPLDNFYGMHVYSRLPILEKEISYLVERDIPSIHTSIELRTGDKVRIHFLHPAPPSPTENTESTERDAELIIVARSIEEKEQPVVVTGDLNDVAWSDTTRLFRKISGLLDPRVGRGMFNTFHVNYPFLRWPLDHLFHSAHFTLKQIKRLPTIGSDHFALFTVLVYDPVQGRDQEAIKANSEDFVHAKKISEEMDLSKKDVPK